MRAYIQLAKGGDVISILPILQQASESEGCKIPLVIAKEYAPILDGVSYVDPVIWHGNANDVSGAILFAKKRFSQVVSLQTWGNLPVQQCTPSFQFDQWKRAGCVEYFDEWPLMFDLRNQERENRMAIKNPYILFGDHSQSSPFLQKEELASMLKAEFPNHAIVRLSEVRAHRIYDLLGLYDNAAALVTVETAHVHLSKASNVPTIVLAANGWRGSAFSPRFRLYMRYAAWERRKATLIDAVRSAVNGEPKLKVSKILTSFDDGYNPSTLDFCGRVMTAYRYHDRGDWRTSLALNDGNETIKLNVPTSIKDYSIEDGRLFEFNGKLHCAYVCSTQIDSRFKCYVAYGEIRGNELGHVHVRYAGNDLMGMNKNWTPFVHDDKIHFIHGIKAESQIVLRVDGHNVQAEYKSPAPTWEFGEIRGGAIVPNNGSLIRFFHSRVGEHANGKYFIGASIIENKPPFKTLAVSTKPVIEGDESYTPGVTSWKPNVSICYGCVVKDGKFLLSYGKNDCECCVVELEMKDLNL